MVLVGGMGTRLRPLTHEIPKQMLCVAGVTMLERVVERLASFGVDRVVLSMGYRPDVFLEAFPAGEVSGVEIVYAVEPEPLDTAGGIRFAADFAGLQETFLVVNGDILCDFDISALMEAHRANPGLATIALIPVDDPSAFGVVATDGDGRVEAFVEKPRREDAPSNLINAGIYVLEPEALASVEPGGRASIEKAVFPLLVSRGQLFALPFDGFWIDAGTVDNFRTVNLEFLSVLVRGDGGAASAAEIDLVGATPAGFELVGDSLVAKSARIDPGARIVASVVGPDAVIEAGSLVVKSVVMAGATVARYAQVLDSIVGVGGVVPPEAVLDEGSVLAKGAPIARGDRLVAQRIPD
ncbi:MAG: NDP-sugar synthase [Nitrospiraceae bacterium]|nr:NDP-sugar synthase [Nitrospiraceae bacterium]MDA8262057.1 NDP-sugar synthase [Actinomycetota bacterium]